MMKSEAVFSRRALAGVLPFAVLATAPAAGLPALATGDDAALLDLGRQWSIALAALHDHDLACVAHPDLAADRSHDALGERLYDEEQVLLDAVMEMPARTLQGFAFKGQALARAFDVMEPSVEAVEAALAREAPDLERCSALAGARHLAAGEGRRMTAQILAFPRSSPVRTGRAARGDFLPSRALPQAYDFAGERTDFLVRGQHLAPTFTPEWCSAHLPLIDAAMDLLSADDDEFARRCALMADDEGRMIVGELAGQLQRLGAHIADVADALGLTAARIRDAMTAQE